MGWLIIAIGVLASGLGAALAYSGLDYIQVERGWTAVLAGTSLLSAGLIVISLGVAVSKLSLIARVLAEAAQPIDMADTVLPDSAPLADEPQWEAAEAEAYAEVAPINPPEQKAMPARESDEGLAPSPLRGMAGVSKPHTEPAKPVEMAASPLTAEDLNSLDWLEEAISDLKLQQEPAPPVFMPPVSRPSVFMQELIKKTELARTEVVQPELPKSEPFKLEPVKPEPVLNPPEPAHYEPSVVGRYEAAGTSYAMYSDGSVEAENEHGVFRFGSMAELRAFIEESQERQAAPPPPQNE